MQRDEGPPLPSPILTSLLVLSVTLAYPIRFCSELDTSFTRQVALILSYVNYTREIKCDNTSQIVTL